MRIVIALIVAVALAAAGWFFFLRDAGQTPGTADAPAGGATTATAPVDVDALIARLPDGLIVTYGAKSFDAATGETVLETVTFAQASTDPAAPITLFTARRVAVAGLDVPGFERIFDAALYTGAPDEAFRVLISKLTLEGVATPEDDAGGFSAERLVLEGLSMKPFAFTPGGENYDAQFVSEETMPFQVMGAVLDALKVARISGEGVRIAINDPGMGSSNDYTIGTVSISEVDRGRIGVLEYDRLSGTTSEQAIGLTYTAASGLSRTEFVDLSGAVPFMIRGEMPPVSARNLISVGRSVSKDIVYDFPGIGRFVVPEGTTSPVPFAWFVPTDFRIDMTGTFTADTENPETGPIFEMIGQSEFPVRVVMDWDYDADAGTGGFSEFRIDLGGLQDASLSFMMGGAPLARFENISAEELETYFTQLTFNGFNLTVVDRGGVDKGVAVFAAMNGMEPDMARAALIEQVQMLAQDPEDPLGQEIAAALAAFLENPGTLVIKAEPPAPVGFSALETLDTDPAGAMRLIGFSARATN